MQNIEVSVLLITYNADLSKLKMTLESILLQKDISMELIVADDGSKVKWNEHIVKTCKKYQFDNYQIVNAPVNVGTVKNLYSAVQVSSGKYVKAISPGDMLYEEQTLRKWVDFMAQKECQLSFGDAVYYNCENCSGINIIETKTAPANIDIFGENQNRKDVFVDYLLANDTIMGASMMVKTEAMKKYLFMFVDKVKYAEDFMARVMIFENQKVLHFPCNVVWYEYGLGISTAKNDKWAALLRKDFDASNDIILSIETYVDNLAEKYVKYLRKERKGNLLRKIYKCIMFPDVISWRMKMKKSTSRTSQNVDKQFIEQIL